MAGDGDLRAALAQIRSLIDDLDVDLPPRKLQGQDDYDAIVEILRRPCPTEHCDECAFSIRGYDGCPPKDVDNLLDKMRGHDGGRS